MSELIPAPRNTTNEMQLGALKRTLPVLITNEGKPATKRFIEFFTANIRNVNTREA